MLKYLLLIALAVVVWSVWQKRARSGQETPRREVPPERMVTCAHCGVHMPLSDSVAAGGRYYCCEAHRQTGAESSS